MRFADGMCRAVVVALLAACHPSVPRPGPEELVTTAERTHYARTGRYDEAVALCHAFARAYDAVTCTTLGTSVEGRPIVALRVGHAHPRHPLPVILVEAGIHAGEIEGKDAGFEFVRDLATERVARGALDVVELVFVPCINPDGHERFGPNNRPNQRGPEEMGFRTNAARLNLNRDFVKADAPETRAILEAFRTLDPAVFVDIHTTDGAKFEPDISITVSPRAPRDDHLDGVAVALADALAGRLTQLGHLPVTFYPSFVVDDDPSSGFAIAEAPPRFSQAYAGIRSRLGFLVENHSWKTYAQRVHSTYDFLRALFERAVTDAPAWVTAEAAARNADAQLGGKDLPVVWDNGPHTADLAFRGYAFTKRESDITGGTWIEYDENKPEIWHVPLRDTLVAQTLAHVPTAGYVVDGGFAAVVAHVLDAHGIAYRPVRGEPRIDVEVFRATKTTTQPMFEGRARMQLDGAWARETRTLDRGAIFVPIRQPNTRLIVNLLDPSGPDSLAAWGEFATCFERKEYMETYVAEQAARDMLQRDPSLRAQLDAAIAADPALAASPKAKLDWFYRRHPAWDERFGLLPVYRSDVELR
jgi:hypothetical protein